MYRPDGKNHELIKEAWSLRVAGESLEVIAKIINGKGYAKKLKSGKIIKLTKQTLSTMFADSFYYGLLRQKGQMVDLTKYYDFSPVTSEADFLIIQSLGHRRLKPSKPFKATFYPFKHLVTCNYCGGTCYVYPSTGRKQRYLYLDCKNKDCPKHNAGLKSKTTAPTSKKKH